MCIAAILFTSLFALDAFEEGKPFGEQILGFLMHLIPQFVLIILLIIAWKYERLGGIIFIVIGTLFSVWMFLHNYDMSENVGWALVSVATISLPFI